MEDYIQGIVCGYLTVQNGTRDDAKRRRLFVVLSDARMDYYVVDPRPEFLESIAESYAFSETTQAHHYAEMNPRAPLHSFCLTTNKSTDVYVAESASEAELWLSHLHERLQALHQMVVGTLVLRKELSITQQVQRTLLQTKYTWRTKHVELGRSTLRFCGPQPQRRTKRAMNQFTLTAESYVSDEPVEVLKRVALAGFAVSNGALSAADLKKLQKDPKFQARAGRSGRGSGPTGSGLVFPFVVCTGPAHVHFAAASEKEREDWILAIKMRIIPLKYRHNATTSGRAVASLDDTTARPRIRMHDFMEVQFVPGGPWTRRYVALENERLHVKRDDRSLGSKFETRLLPSCVLSPSLVKANAFVVQNLCQEIALAPGTHEDAQRWKRAIQTVACEHVTRTQCLKVFHDDVAALLAHSVVYTITVAGDDAGAYAGFVVEKYKKRIFVLSHQPPATTTGSSSTTATTTTTTTAPTIPEGSVLLGIAQVGMVHDSFETVWHSLRQKKSVRGHVMKLTFRAPMHKTSLVDVKFKPKERWALRRCVLRHGKLLLEPALPLTETTTASATACTPVLAIPLRFCHAELLTSDLLGVRNTLKLTVTSNGVPHLPPCLYLRVHHDGDLFHWFALLQLECAVAQDDVTYPLTLQTLKDATQRGRGRVPSPLGYAEDQRKQTSKCRVAGQCLHDLELATKALEPKLLQHARVEQQQQQREEELLVATESPVSLDLVDVQVAAAISDHVTPPTAGLSDDDVRQLFQHLDAIGCGKISSRALASTVDALTRQLDVVERRRILDSIDSALAKIVPASRQFVSMTLEQTASVLRNLTDARVVDLVRKFSRHEIQFM